MTSLIESLVSEGCLVSPEGRSGLTFQSRGLEDSAGRVFVEANGAIDLVPNYEADLSYLEPPREFVASICKHFGFDASNPADFRIFDGILRSTLLAPAEADLRAEIREFASRMGVQEPEAWPPGNDRSRKPIAPVNLNPRLSIVRDFLPSTLETGYRNFFSFRVKNIGTATLSSRVDPPLFLSSHWALPNGEVVVFEGERGHLPRDLDPGDEVTVLVPLTCPDKPGEYFLQIRPLLEGVRWLDDLGADYHVEISDEVAGITSLTNWTREDFDLDADLRYAKETLQAAVGVPTEGKRVLELAGGVYPLALSLCADGVSLVSTDISFAMSQLGAVLARRQGIDEGTVQFLAADALRLPFNSAVFDCAVICAALHHFADPAAMLRTVRPLIKAGGCLAVVREPCQPNPFDTAYLRDIATGINEQQFNLLEYERIFLDAGYSIESVSVRSGGSLMTVLRPSHTPSSRAEPPSTSLS